MTISQREARQLRKRVNELERREKSRFSRWGSEYVGGTNICAAKFDQDGKIHTAIKTARVLKHAVVVTTDDTGAVYFHALPAPSN